MAQSIEMGEEDMSEDELQKQAEEAYQKQLAIVQSRYAGIPASPREMELEIGLRGMLAFMLEQLAEYGGLLADGEIDKHLETLAGWERLVEGEPDSTLSAELIGG